MADIPELGDERHALDEAAPGGVWVDHLVFAEGGPSSFYDEQAKDFVTVPGAWIRVRRFGPFLSRAEATTHMVGMLGARRRAPAAAEVRAAAQVVAEWFDQEDADADDVAIAQRILLAAEQVRAAAREGESAPAGWQHGVVMGDGRVWGCGEGDDGLTRQRMRLRYADVIAPCLIGPQLRTPTGHPVDACSCGHEDSDGRGDVLACPVHGIGLDPTEAHRSQSEGGA